MPTKNQLLETCETLRSNDIKNRYVTPDYFKSWNKLQLTQYIEYMKTDRAVRRRNVVIDGTIHKEKY